ncbi:WXG100 family type VII secretion target [Nocardia heshunensis]
MSDDDGYSVDLDELDALVSRLSNLSKFLTDQFTALDTKVATLRAGGWNSDAAAAYEDAHRQWLTGAQEFAQGVTDVSDAASNAHRHYSSAIGANTQMFGGR